MEVSAETLPNTARNTAPMTEDEYRDRSKMKFDPKIHLNNVPPEKIYTMTELGVPPNGTSNLATTEPFQIATEAAVMDLRRELLQENTLKRRMHWWHRSPA